MGQGEWPAFDGKRVRVVPNVTDEEHVLAAFRCPPLLDGRK